MNIRNLKESFLVKIITIQLLDYIVYWKIYQNKTHDSKNIKNWSGNMYFGFLLLLILTIFKMESANLYI